MYCTKCGKKLDYEAKICNECAAESAAAEPYPNAVNANTEANNPNYTPYGNAQETVGAIAAREPAGVYATAQPTAYENISADTDTAEPRPEGNKKFGFPKALVATILGAIGSIISGLNLYVTGVFSFISGLLEFGGEMEMGSALSTGGVVISVILGIITLAMGIVATCFGAISIKAFKSHKAETGVAPVATLVLGIVGLVLGIECIIASVDLFPTLIVDAIGDAARNAIFGMGSNSF